MLQTPFNTKSTSHKSNGGNANESEGPLAPSGAPAES